MLLCRCVLLCTHLRDLVPRFRRHPFLDLGLESVCVCVCMREDLSVMRRCLRLQKRRVVFRSLALECVGECIISCLQFGSLQCGQVFLGQMIIRYL